MTLFLKADRYQDPSSSKQSLRESLLLPLDGSRGYVFLLIDVANPKDGADRFISLLAEQVERLISTFTPDANPQHRFEQFLEALNETLAQHVRNGAWNIAIKDLNALVGIVCDESIFLSGTGDLTTLFLHRDPNSQRYQIFNLFRSIQTEQSLLTWEKVFAVVLDGTMHTGDVLVASSHDLQRQIDAHSLNTLLSTLPPKSASANIRQYFGPKDELTLLIVKAELEHAPTVSQTPTQQSVEQFIETTEETQLLLGDQAKQAKKMANSMKHRVKQTVESKRLPLIKPLWSLLVSLTTVLGKMAMGFVSWVLKIVPLLTKSSYRKHLAMQWRLWFAKKTGRPVSNKPGIQKSTRYLLIAGAVLLFVILISIWGVSRASTRANAEKAYQLQAAAVEALIEKGAGAIIYKDEQKALELFGEAETAAQSLPEDTPERMERNKELRERIEQGFSELRHIIAIPEPPVIADLRALGSFKHLTQDNDNFLIVADNKLVRTNTSSGQSQILELDLSSIGTIASVSQEDETVYFLSTSGDVFSWNTQEETITQTSITAPENQRWVDVVAYANRLYILQPAGGGSEGQLLRFTNDDPETENRWIRSQSSDLTRAVDTVIDGTVFILSADGSIVRFTSGSEIGWDRGIVDPPINDATRIWTDAASTFVYVLESKHSRVIVFRKDTGAFVVQYQSDAFASATDFLVNEQNQSITILTPTVLHQIQASHLIGE